MQLRRLASAGAVVAGVATIGYPMGTPISPDAVGALRALLVVCAVALIVVGVASAVTGHTAQATGHLLAGAGIALAAASGEGIGAWAGILAAAIGGVVLVRDAIERGRRQRPLV